MDAEEDKLLTSLQLEQAKAPKITKGMILFLLDKFRQMDMRVMKNREKLIDSLVKAIILYDDRILIYLTYTDETVTISTSEGVSDVENSLDVTSSGVPTINKRDTQPGIPLIYFRYAKGLEQSKCKAPGEPCSRGLGRAIQLSAPKGADVNESLSAYRQISFNTDILKQKTDTSVPVF